jgi:peptide/nickel transport system substrate-binding protein
MKKLLLIPIVIIVIVGLVLGGCGKPAATTTPPTTTPPTTTPPTTTPPTTTPPTTTPPTTTPPTTTPPTTTAAPYGTVTIAEADFGYESTDPVNLESTWGWAMYDALLRWDENGVLIPGVADSWTFDSATNTYTFQIHQGIKFWNGEDLTAEDVKFSVDRFSDMTLSTNPWSRYLSKGYNQVETRVVGDYTFQFVQDHPEPSQLIIMAWVRILPKTYYETVGIDEFRAHPMGSGPWKFVELVPETSFTLEANTNYWKPDEIPAFQYLVELQVPEQATRISMLRTGEVDILPFPDRDRINGLKSDGFTAFKIGVPGTASLALQGSWLPNAGPISDIRVRQALSYAINRQELCDTLYDGYAVPGGLFYEFPGAYGWSDALAADPYDPQKAMDLMEEAGYPDAFADPTINCYTTAAGGLSGGPDIFLLLESYWEAVGFDVELHIVDSTIFSNYIFNGFQRFVGTEENIGWIGMWNYDAFFNPTYQHANMYTSGGIHNTANDPVADEMYQKATTETDPVLAEQYYKEFQVYARNMYVNIGVAQTDQYVIWNPLTIGGWTGRTWVSYWDSWYGIQHAD